MTTDQAPTRKTEGAQGPEPSTATLVVIATLVLTGAAGSAIMAYLVQG